MVDANVWVDSFCADHSESLAARAFIGQATEAGALLFFPVHIAKDVLHVVQHELKRSVLAGGCSYSFVNWEMLSVRPNRGMLTPSH